MKPGRRLACLSLLAPVLAFAQRGDAPEARLRSAAESQALFHLPPGFEIQLVAAEPDLQKPLNFSFDAAGRVWVTGSTLYPWPARRDALGQPIATFEQHWGETNLAFRAAATAPEPPEHGADTVRVLSAFGPDGRARRSTVFADGLNIPVGVLPLPRAPGAKGDTVLVFSIPAIWRLTDTDGDGRADVREKLYDGFGFKDTHGMSSSYWLWFDGWVYGTHGFANRSEVVDRAGRTVPLTSGNTYRFRPDGSRFERFAHGQTNPFGLAFDARGDRYTADSHSKPVYLVLPGGHYEGINREHDGLGFAPAITADNHGSSAIAGIAHYSAAHFPPEFRDNLFNGNPVTRRINRTRLEWRGSSPVAARQPDFLTSDDPSFRPVQVQLGPDGALWIADFYNPIIGHYEVPLTHPARDQAHGRIWRVVWRGLDGTVPPPVPPDLTRASTAALAARLTDANLVVRSLALAALLARPDASATAPELRATLARLIDGTDPAADGTAALPLAFALDRLGHGDDRLLQRALLRPDSAPAHAALRVWTERGSLPENARAVLTALVGDQTGDDGSPRGGPGYGWRMLAELLARRPQPWGAKLLLAMQARLAPPVAAKEPAPDPDPELTYALRLALKAHALTADLTALRAWAGSGAAAAERVADVCVAVTTPAAAEFLLGYLAETQFAGPRTGELARHAVLQLPSDRLALIAGLLEPLSGAPPAQRVAFAEGLAAVAAQPDRTLPENVAAWMRRELLTAIEGKEPARALRAINAVKPLALPEAIGPLSRVALEKSGREANRIAALRALPLATPATEETAVAVLAATPSQGLRRTAADVLGTATTGPAARAALREAFASASSDLALIIAIALARSDTGAADLLDLAEAGRVRPTLLKHRYVAAALAGRPAPVRDRAAALTRALPPEDARLDAVIAQRLGAAPGFTGRPERGAAVFALHCAACHQFRNTGGRLGPGLDGLESRPLPRLIEDILDPNRNVDPAFRLTSITLKDGGTRSGLNFREEAARLVLTDPATGQEITVARADAAETTTLPLSPMPATFETTLSEEELFDLLEYLRRPGAH